MADKDHEPLPGSARFHLEKKFKKQADSWGKNEISSHLQWVSRPHEFAAPLEVLDVAAGSALF